MKNDHPVIFIYVLFFVFIFGCTKEYEENYSDVIIGKDIIINNNLQQLNRKLTSENKHIAVTPFTQKKLKSGGYADEPQLEKNFEFTLIAESFPPVFKGVTLQATHVDVYNNYAFVSFNLKGMEYLGGVQVLDISIPENPLIISEAIFPNIDVSSLEYYESKLYLAGAYDPTVNDTTYETPAVIDILSLNSAMQITATDTIIDVPGYVGTDVIVRMVKGSAKIMCTSGNNGEYLVYDPGSLNKDIGIDLADARAVDSYEDKMYVLKNNPGEVVVVENSAVSMAYALSENLTPESKSEIAVNEHGIFAAMNAGGLQYLKLDGTDFQHIPKPEARPGELEENFVTNSVAVNNKLVLIGNGGAGAYVGYIGEETNDSIALLGKMNFNGSESVNFVYAEDNLVFVASGLGGLKILTYELKDDFELKTCKTTLNDIEGFLPENINNRDRHPEYFSDTLNFNVHITKETNVYIAFLHEGAGYRNALGYYTYPRGQRPDSPDQLEKNVIFPCIEGEGNNALPKQVKYQLGDTTFAENTVIGFYAVIDAADGQCRPKEGSYTIYTDQAFNSNNDQQFTLMYNDDCKDLILTFEDILLPEGDRDYNDGVFIISDNPTDTIVSTSFDLTRIPLATEL
jgi:hypothetical protein